MYEKCDGAFLEEVEERWQFRHTIDAYTFPRLLELAKKADLIHASQDDFAQLRTELAEAKEEIARFGKRDCNATVELCYDDGNDPFARETLKVVDVGVSDNIYIVESQTVNQLQAEIQRLKIELDGR